LAASLGEKNHALRRSGPRLWRPRRRTPPAEADVVTATPGSFELRASQTVPASPERAWNALVRVGDWWNNEHTYSGNGHNMRLDLRPGGCWCERWRDGAIEHGRVLLVM